MTFANSFGHFPSCVLKPNPRSNSCSMVVTDAACNSMSGGSSMPMPCGCFDLLSGLHGTHHQEDAEMRQHLLEAITAVCFASPGTDHQCDPCPAGHPWLASACRSRASTAPRQPLHSMREVKKDHGALTPCRAVSIQSAPVGQRLCSRPAGRILGQEYPVPFSATRPPLRYHFKVRRFECCPM